MRTVGKPESADWVPIIWNGVRSQTTNSDKLTDKLPLA